MKIEKARKKRRLVGGRSDRLNPSPCPAENNAVRISVVLLGVCHTLAVQDSHVMHEEGVNHSMTIRSFLPRVGAQAKHQKGEKLARLRS